MKCFGCGEEREVFVICAQPRGDEPYGWKHAVVCEPCTVRLDLDMWISSDCWRGIDPKVPWDALPDHTEATCGCDTPEIFAHVVVP